MRNLKRFKCEAFGFKCEASYGQVVLMRSIEILMRSKRLFLYMLLLLLVAWLFAIEGRAVVVDQKIEPPEDSSALAERFGYDLTEKELHLLAVEEATDGIRRIYVNGEITDIVLVQPGEYDGGGKAKVMYEEISTTGWVTQYVDEDDSGDCDFVLVWQPVIISDGPFYEVCFSLKDVQECPEGGAL